MKWTNLFALVFIALLFYQCKNNTAVKGTSDQKATETAPADTEEHTSVDYQDIWVPENLITKWFDASKEVSLSYNNVHYDILQRYTEEGSTMNEATMIGLLQKELETTDTALESTIRITDSLEKSLRAISCKKTYAHFPKLKAHLAKAREFSQLSKSKLAGAQGMQRAQMEPRLYAAVDALDSIKSLKEQMHKDWVSILDRYRFCQGVLSNSFKLGQVMPLVGCSCYLSRNEEDFKNHRYILASDFNGKAVMKINLSRIEFKTKDQSTDPVVWKSEDYSMEVSLKQTTKMEEGNEVAKHEGFLLLKTSEGEVIEKYPLFGECGC